MDTSSIRIHVNGKVQGVFFRESARRRAEDLGIEGTAENLADGRVKLVAKGPEEKLQQFVQWCHEGPSAASVTHVEVAAAEPFNGTGFKVLR